MANPESRCGRPARRRKCGLRRSSATAWLSSAAPIPTCTQWTPNSGSKVWTQELGGKIYSTASISARHLYAGCGDGKVYCLDTASGKILWSTPTGNGIDSSPAVAGDTVLIGSEDFFFYALDADTGSVTLEIRNRPGHFFLSRGFGGPGRRRQQGRISLRTRDSKRPPALESSGG